MKLQWFIVYLLLGKQIVQFNVVLYVTEFCVTFRAWHFLILDVADHVSNTWSCDTLNGVVFRFRELQFCRRYVYRFRSPLLCGTLLFWQVYRNRSPLLLEIYWFRIKYITLYEPNSDYTGVLQAFWGLSFFSSSLMMCIFRSVIVRLSPGCRWYSDINIHKWHRCDTRQPFPGLG